MRPSSFSTTYMPVPPYIKFSVSARQSTFIPAREDLTCTTVLGMTYPRPPRYAHLESGDLDPRTRTGASPHDGRTQRPDNGKEICTPDSVQRRRQARTPAMCPSCHASLP
ncbi:MAG: hypothetical protein Q9224_000209 [Gallowayella concinna]